MFDWLQNLYNFFYWTFTNYNITGTVLGNSQAWIEASLGIMVALPFIGIIRKLINYI